MKFLVAIDGSEEARDALAHTIEITDAMDTPEAMITVVHAVDPDVYEVVGSGPVSTLSDANERLLLESVEDAEERGLDVLEEAAEFATNLGQEVETELLYGGPVEEVTDYAADGDFDAIVVGHHGRSEHTDAMLGSVAKGIVERATLPVTVVR